MGQYLIIHCGKTAKKINVEKKEKNRKKENKYLFFSHQESNPGSLAYNSKSVPLPYSLEYMNNREKNTHMSQAAHTWLVIYVHDNNCITF